MEQNTQKRFSASWTNLVKRREDWTGQSRLLGNFDLAVHDIHMSLKMAKSILIGTHEHPDGDALGSALALLHVLRLQGKEVVAFAPDPAPDMFKFLPGIEQIVYGVPPDLSLFDVVVLLDSTTTERAHLGGLIESHPLTICIDHHVHDTYQCKLNLIVPEAAATAHILTEFFNKTNTPITKDVATCLLTGIFTDTGSFMHDSTSPDILKLAASLMGKGARLSHIAHETYQKKELPGLKIWGRALSRIMMNEKTGATVSIITANDLVECGATLDDLSGVVNMLNTLPETKFALLLTEYENGKIKGSLRSEPHKGVDVSAIAKKFGGGGHKLAAGFEVVGHLIESDGQWRVIAP